MRQICWILMLLVSLGMGFGCQSSDAKGRSDSPGVLEPVVILKDLHLLDVSGGTMEGPTDILLEGDRIKAVGALKDLEGKATLIDCSGKYAIPGLFDCHTHLSFLAREGDEKQR